MATDKVTKEQRHSIHQGGRKLGYQEGVRSGINQLTMYQNPDEVAKLPLPILGVVLDTMDYDPPQRKRFDFVAWDDLGVATLGDLHLLNSEELAATQGNPADGAVFAEAVIGALAVFNLKS